MSKKTTSTSTINYDPQGMNQYQQNIGTSMPIQRDFAQNPYSNPFFQMNMGMLNKQAAVTGQRGMDNIFANAKQMGVPGGALSPFLASMIARQGRATSGLQQQGLFGAMNQAQQMQAMALQGLNAFQPLLTGQKTEEKQSGGMLSSILGAAGAIAPFALAPFTGGLSLAGTMIPAAAGGGLSLASKAMQGPMSNISNNDLLGGLLSKQQGSINNDLLGGLLKQGSSSYNSTGFGSNAFLPGESLGMPTSLPLPFYNPVPFH